MAHTATSTDQSALGGGTLCSSSTSVEKQSLTENNMEVKNMPATISAMGKKAAVISCGLPIKLVMSKAMMAVTMKITPQVTT